MEANRALRTSSTNAALSSPARSMRSCSVQPDLPSSRASSRSSPCEDSAASEHGFTDGSHRRTTFQTSLHGPRTSTLHAGMIHDHVHERLAGLGILVVQNLSGDFGSGRSSRTPLFHSANTSPISSASMPSPRRRMSYASPITCISAYSMPLCTILTKWPAPSVPMWVTHGSPFTLAAMD